MEGSIFFNPVSAFSRAYALAPAVVGEKKEEKEGKTPTELLSQNLAHETIPRYENKRELAFEHFRILDTYIYALKPQVKQLMHKPGETWDADDIDVALVFIGGSYLVARQRLAMAQFFYTGAKRQEHTRAAVVVFSTLLDREVEVPADWKEYMDVLSALVKQTRKAYAYDEKRKPIKTCRVYARGKYFQLSRPEHLKIDDFLLTGFLLQGLTPHLLKEPEEQ